MAKAYDRGTPAVAERVATKVYTVPSWRQAGTSYTVDLTQGHCDCPDHTKRKRDCKHIQQARAARYETLVQTARTLTTEQLSALLGKYEGDRAVWVAILGELHDRTQQAAG